MCPLFDLSFQPGYQPRKRLPTPPDVCAPGSTRPLRNFYTLQLRTDITGPARLLSVRVGATLQQEPKYETNSCDAAPCEPVRCCPNGTTGYLFTYQARGSEGTPYYGYDYGFQWYYGEGYDYEAPVNDQPDIYDPDGPPAPPPVPPPVPPDVPLTFEIPTVNGWQNEMGFTGSYPSMYGITKITDDITADGMTAEKATFWQQLVYNEFIAASPTPPTYMQLVYAWDWVDPYAAFIGDFNDKFSTGSVVPLPGDPVYQPGAYWRLIILTK